MVSVTVGIQQRVAEQYAQSQHWLALVDVDGDPEALHQYRVCLRRARSLLQLYRLALRHTPAAILSKLFSEQARVANQALDLDVFYQGITQNRLHDHFGQWRVRAYQEFTVALAELRQERAICQWLTQLSWPIEALSLEAETNLVRQQLKFQVATQCQKLTARTTTARWHTLRILIKRWRYLETLCGDEKQLKPLKAGQEQLGAFNDLCAIGVVG